MKLLALTKYGDRAASVRQRLLQFRPFLTESNITIECHPLLDNEYLKRTLQGRRPPLLRIGRSYLDRLVSLLFLRNFDVLWVQYELFPYVLGVAEKLAFVSSKPIVCDFDDAIFHQYDAHANPLVRRLLGRKLEPLLRGASLCICGNAYLKSYADQFCPRTEIVPTVLDTTVYVPGGVGQRPLTIGWIGSPSTWTFVQPLIPLLQRLADEMGLVIRVVGAGAGRANPAGSRFQFLEWSEESEIASIQGMDIGVMPLPDEPWARGKCGYKLIQYMACGVPVVASPVGVNSDIVDEGVNGFLARTESEWEAAIRRLAASPELRATLGARGREKVVNAYSLQVHGPRLAALLREVVDAA
jgi:glycosyltransferase involved in cell wall biosynthesis